MKRINPIVIILLTCLALIYAAGCATGTKNIEKVLREQRWNDLDAAVSDYWSLWRFNEVDTFGVRQPQMKKDMEAVAAFIRQDEACQSIVASATIDERQTCYQMTLDKRKHIPSPLPFTRLFVDDLNNRSHRARENYQAIVRIKEDQERQRLDKEKEQKQRDEKEHEWKREADTLLNDIYEKAHDTPQCIAKSTECSVCDMIESKRSLEQGIKNEQSYSAKYGVVNLSKIDGYKQEIMKLDHLMSNYKKTYKKHTGKDFDGARCRKTCDEEFNKLLEDTVSQSINNKLSTVQDQDKKDFMAKYMGNRQLSK